MAKFRITWQEERTALVEAADIKDAEQQMFYKIKTYSRPEDVKLLSIIRVDPPTPPRPLASAA